MTDHYQMQRGWLDNPALQGGPFDRRSAWAWLIEKANWKPGPYPAGGCTIDVERGQLCHSYRYIATAWGWSVGAVQRFINRLKTDTMVDTQTVGGRLVITICNYNKYQASCRPKNTATDTPADTTPIRDRYRAKNILTNYVEDTRGVGGTGGTVASDPPPPPEPDEHGQGDIDKLARWAEATGYDRREVAQLHAAPIESAPPDLGLPDLGGNVVSIGTGKPTKPRDAPGTRWPAGQRVPDDWIAEGRAIRRDAGLPEINMQLVADMFADHWASAPRSKGVKSDWRATWRNWVRRQDQFGGRNHGQRNSAERNGYSRSGEGSSEEINLRGILRGVPGLGLGSG